jgi:hypothetical protein
LHGLPVLLPDHHRQWVQLLHQYCLRRSSFLLERLRRLRSAVHRLTRLHLPRVFHRVLRFSSHQPLNPGPGSVLVRRRSSSDGLHGDLLWLGLPRRVQTMLRLP